eukprot:ANDGO_03047.mRNA.1 hypothetical protein
MTGSKANKSALSVLDGIRGFAQLWTFSFHFSLWFSLKLAMSSSVYQSYKSFAYGSFMQNGHLATDVLFFLSGFLAFYQLKQIVGHKRHLSMQQCVVFCILRLIRLYIPYVLVMLLAYVSSSQCRDISWYYFTLQHHTLPMALHICGGHLWSVPLDLIFPSVLALVFVFSPFRWSAKLWIAILLASTAPVVVSEWRKYDSVVPPIDLFSLQTMILDDKNDIIREMGIVYEANYLQPNSAVRVHSYLQNYSWYGARGPSFAIGAFVAWIVFASTAKIQKRAVAIAAWMGLPTTFAIFWFYTFHNVLFESPPLSPLFWSVAFALMRPAMGVCFGAWLLIGLLAGQSDGLTASIAMPFASIFNAVASLRIWKPLSSIGYSFSLIHVIVLTGFFMTVNPHEILVDSVTREFSTVVFWKYFGILFFLSMVISAIYYWLVEKPTVHLKNLVSRLFTATPKSKAT